MLRPCPVARPAARRGGVAAVEAAVVLNFVLLPMLVGLWEMGRAVQVQQMVANAAREGARLAGQGRTINQTGTPTQINATNPAGVPLPSVQSAVYQSLVGAGLTGLAWGDVTVAFKFLDGNTSNTNPSQGVKNQRFSVAVSINYDEKVRWVNLGFVNPGTIVYTVEWRMLVDDPFTVSTAIPSW